MLTLAHTQPCLPARVAHLRHREMIVPRSASTLLLAARLLCPEFRQSLEIPAAGENTSRYLWNRYEERARGPGETGYHLNSGPGSLLYTGRRFFLFLFFKTVVISSGRE